MTVIRKSIGRLPMNLGDYDSTRVYGKKNRVFMYGCEWESKVENNTYAPAALDTQAGTITPDTTHWRLVSGSYDVWLLDHGYKTLNYIPTSQKGQAGGVATLDNGGKVPAEQLPSYIDDVVELSELSSTPPSTCVAGDLYFNTTSNKIFEAIDDNTWASTGVDPERGKVYIDISSNKTFRWGRSVMIPISNDIDIDSALSNMSENPVQNKVVKAAIDHIISTEIKAKIKDLLRFSMKDGILFLTVEGETIGNGYVADGGELVESGVYGDIVTDVQQLSIVSGGTGTLGVKLSKKPTSSQTITLTSDNSVISLSPSTLTFYRSNWNTYQYVTIENISVSPVALDVNVVLTNSDPFLTETTRKVSLGAASYSGLVDTTIPTEGQHILTVDDFDSISDYNGTHIRLGAYTGNYDNVVVPSTIDGKICWVKPETFGGNTTIKYVTFENGVIYRGGGTTTGCFADSIFANCTSLIGVSNMNVATTSLQGTFVGCTSLKFIDNISNLVNVESLSSTFAGSGIEYIPDLSRWDKLGFVQQAFRNCSNLRYIFGFPEALDTTSSEYSAAATNMYNGCTKLIRAYVPAGITNLSFLTGSYASYIKEIYVYSDNVSTAEDYFAAPTKNLTFRCNKNTTTYNTLLAAYSGSTKISVLGFNESETLPSIVVWGESISSPNKAWIEWPKRLQEHVSDYLVKNEALAGEWSSSTTIRQGGWTLSVGAFTIPSDTSAVEVTLTQHGDVNTVLNPNPLFSGSVDFNPCKINNVVGILYLDNKKYYFARDEAGAAVSVPAGTTVISLQDEQFNNANNIMLFYLNGNAGWNDDADTLLDMFKKAVAHFTAKGGTKYIVAGPATGPALRTQAQREQVALFEAAAATEFGSHWLNIRQYQIDNGLTQNNLTASALDNERIAEGLVPASLLGAGDTTNIAIYGTNSTDDVHPNAYGANTIYLGFYEKGKALGYWS